MRTLAYGNTKTSVRRLRARIFLVSMYVTQTATANTEKVCWKLFFAPVFDIKVGKIVCVSHSIFENLLPKADNLSKA